MYHCIHCTAASTYSDSTKVCQACPNIVHLCDGCHDVNVVPAMACYLCVRGLGPGHKHRTVATKPVIPRVKCQCKNSQVRRLQVNKNNRNHGRYFYSCNICNFFQWDDSDSGNTDTASSNTSDNQTKFWNLPGFYAKVGSRRYHWTTYST